MLLIARPFNSVFGTDDNIVDVPRNVTIISRQQLSDISIVDVLDFSKLRPARSPRRISARRQRQHPRPVGRRVPERRALAHHFQRQRPPIDFNSVESVNIVKGPATAVQGTSMYVGGFIDLISKRPYFDKTRGVVSATYGSYDTKRWMIDVGGPISAKSAYRFSYSGEDTAGYYHDGFKKTHSFYGALEFRPSTNYNIFINAQVFRCVLHGELGHQSRDPEAHRRRPVPDRHQRQQRPERALRSAELHLGDRRRQHHGVGPEVELNRHVRLLKPGNDSSGKEFNIQAIQTAKISDTVNFKNTTIYSRTKRDTLSTYYYSGGHRSVGIRREPHRVHLQAAEVHREHGSRPSLPAHDGL